MRRARSGLGAVVALLSATWLTVACGSSRTATSSGAGGVTGRGGAAPGGGGIAGAGGAVPGSTITGTSAGGTGAGGKASGGTGLGGIGPGGAGGSASGGTGGIASGGAGGSGPSGAGGRASGGGGGIVGTGGTGGRASGGTGGIGTGGVALDGGCSGTLCAKDAAAIDGDRPSCSELDSTDCDLRNDCHSVYVDPRNCTCTEESCCMHFDHCADGDTTDCTGPALCNSVAPVCEGQYYTVGFRNGCYEGCVRKNECTIPACPQAPPTDGTSCGPVDVPCFYQDCAGKGRTLASCTNGVWSVQTAACGSFPCEGANVTPAQVTCAANQVCVRTNKSNVAVIVQPSCVDNSCGANPIALECLGGLSGTCEVQVSATAGTIYCVLPPPCQGAGGCDYAYP